MSAASSQNMDVGSDSESDDEGEVFNFDTIAHQAVTAVSAPSAGANSRQLRELSLDVGLSADQLYLTSSNASSRPAFDTSAPPGVCQLDTQEFGVGLGINAPAASTRCNIRDVRGAPVRPENDKKMRAKEAKVRKDDKLDKWFGMPKRTLTPEMEAQLKVLKLRGAYDPKRFYKSNDSKTLPTHFQFATEMGGGLAAAGLKANAEVHWNSGRSFLDSVLRDQKGQEFMARKYSEVGSRGQAGYNSGHGKPGAKGRKDLKGTKRGGNWKQKRS